jgi:hypothetical protein
MQKRKARHRWSAVAPLVKKKTRLLLLNSEINRKEEMRLPPACREKKSNAAGLLREEKHGVVGLPLCH